MAHGSYPGGEQNNGKSKLYTPSGATVPTVGTWLCRTTALPTETSGNMPLRHLSEHSGWKKCRRTNALYPLGWPRICVTLMQADGIFFSKLLSAAVVTMPVSRVVWTMALWLLHLWIPPNDYGLYNMAGNVSRWVMDTYRPLSYRDFDDLNLSRHDGLDEIKTGTRRESHNYNSDVTKPGYTSLLQMAPAFTKAALGKNVALLDVMYGTRNISTRFSHCQLVSVALWFAGSDY